MAGPFYLKPPQSLHVLSFKEPNSISMKIRNLIRSHIFRLIWRLVRGLTKAKSLLIELVRENYPHYFTETFMKNNISKRKKKQKIFSSFRMHYNWSSSHIIPMPESIVDGLDSSHAYYDSSWNSIFPAEECDAMAESQLSGYLHWLEEKASENSATDIDIEVDEIDRLADLFIANCHEKFRLEKQESYRRYQEMMARSM